MLSDDLLSEYRIIDAQRVFSLCVVLNALRVLTAKPLNASCIQHTAPS